MTFLLVRLAVTPNSRTAREWIDRPRGDFRGRHLAPGAAARRATLEEPSIFDAVRGIRAGGDAKILMLGNPDFEGGPYGDAFRSPGWTTFTISAFDTPNLSSLKQKPDEHCQDTLKTLLALLPDHELDVAPRPYLVTCCWVREMHDECGIDSPLWESRVLGQFPAQNWTCPIALDRQLGGSHVCSPLG
jgi:hypothetical protein